jgi:hypothetical protein
MERKEGAKWAEWRLLPYLARREGLGLASFFERRKCDIVLSGFGFYRNGSLPFPPFTRSRYPGYCVSVPCPFSFHSYVAPNRALRCRNIPFHAMHTRRASCSMIESRKSIAQNASSRNYLHLLHLHLRSGYRATHSLLPASKELLPIPPALAQPITKPLAPPAIHPVAQLAILVHLRPAVPPPLTARHINHEVAIHLLIVDLGIDPLVTLLAILSAGAGREGVDSSLLNEGDVGADPGLIGVEVLEGVLLLVFPFHVFLLVEDGVPPDVKQAVGEGGAFDEEGAEVEAGAVLRDEEGDGGGVVVAGGGGGDRVEEGGAGWVGDR